MNIDEQIEYEFDDWKPLLRFIMESNRLKEENEQLRLQVRQLENQVYGGTTK